MSTTKLMVHVWLVKDSLLYHKIERVASSLTVLVEISLPEMDHAKHAHLTKYPLRISWDVLLPFVQTKVTPLLEMVNVTDMINPWKQDIKILKRKQVNLPMQSYH